MESSTIDATAHDAPQDAGDAPGPGSTGAADAAPRDRPGYPGNGRGPTAAAEAAAATEDARRASAAREQSLYGPNQGAWHEPAESVDATAEQVVLHTAEQTEVLAKLIGSMFIAASGLPARARSAQWPVGADGTPAGDFWRVPPDEALELGRCWAAVIAIYAPVEMIGGASVLIVAIGTTGIAVGARVLEDASRSRQVRAMMDDATARAVASAPAA